MQEIEATAQLLRSSGRCAAWFAGADPMVAKARRMLRALCRMSMLAVYVAVVQVSEGVNGPLMLLLAEACGYHDAAAIELFRRGGPLVRLCGLGCLVFADSLGLLCFVSGRCARTEWQWH